MKIIPVILSGGGGTRLWPLSTPTQPKQFLALTAEETMFQLTLARVGDRDMFEAPIIVGNAAHADMIAAQLAEAGIDNATVILEPCARNTAPAIALAALAAANGNSPLLVMPSDHLIGDVAAFHAAIMAARTLVEDGWLVTFGITPTAPETGYGYIQVGAPLTHGLARVARFVEKPDLANAQAMLDAGDHAWNGGIFLFRADIYLGHLAALAPDILAAAQAAMQGATREGAMLTPDADAFGASPSNSIDYAVMEKAASGANARVAVAPVTMGWSDIGSWDALHDVGEKDSDNNVTSGSVRIDEATGNIIHANGIRVSVHGVHDVIIVANGSEVLVLPRGKSQKVRDFAEG